jgi:hypothetical protein
MYAIAAAELPPAFLEIETWSVRTHKDLAWLRAALRRVLTGAAAADGPEAEIPGRICLVASEIAADTMRYHHTPTVVRLLSDGRQFIIDVAGTAGGPSATIWPEDHGEGLALARRVADDVGWFQTWNARHVWARFDVPAWAAMAAA